MTTMRPMLHGNTAIVGGVMTKNRRGLRGYSRNLYSPTRQESQLSRQSAALAATSREVLRKARIFNKCKAFWGSSVVAKIATRPTPKPHAPLRLHQGGPNVMNKPSWPIHQRPDLTYDRICKSRRLNIIWTRLYAPLGRLE